MDYLAREEQIYADAERHQRAQDASDGAYAAEVDLMVSCPLCAPQGRHYARLRAHDGHVHRLTEADRSRMHEIQDRLRLEREGLA